MAKKKETEQRKRAKDYLVEYTGTLLKVAGIESRIKLRTLNLCMMFPDIMIPLTKEHGLKKGGYTTREFQEGIEIGMTADVEDFLKVMKLIEDYVDSLHPHQQQDLPFN
jgi:hypothetical protein